RGAVEVSYEFVLNASRHHRYFHPQQGCTSTSMTSAQRLAASQVLSRVTTWGCDVPPFLCSTPRGITGTFTPVMLDYFVGHLGCSTPRGITGTFTVCVLTSFLFSTCLIINHALNFHRPVSPITFLNGS